MAAARLIFCERTNRWAAALGRWLSDPEIQVRQTRSLDECHEELSAAPASLVVLELAQGNLAAVLARLVDWNRGFPLARAAVVAERTWEPYEWLLREAGAVDFAASPRRLDSLAGIARRHWRRLPASATDPTERIWSSLPWAAYARQAAPPKTGGRSSC